MQLYQQAGYLLIYGTFHGELQLTPFYESRGFTVLPRNTGLPPKFLLSAPVFIRPGPGERIFLRLS